MELILDLLFYLAVIVFFLIIILGIKGFIPTSQFKNQVSVGQELELKILSIDAEANNFIFSSNIKTHICVYFLTHIKQQL